MNKKIKEGLEILKEVDVLLQDGKYIEAMDVFLTAYKEQQEYYNHQLQKAKQAGRDEENGRICKAYEDYCNHEIDLPEWHKALQNNK